MSNAPVKPSHPLMVSSVFEVSETLPPADNRNYTYRGATVAITCDGWEGDNSREYDGALIAYCGPMEIPEDEHCYSIRAKMIPEVDSADFKLYHEADHKILVGTTNTFAGELNNNTSASGFGVVDSKHEIPEPNSNDTTLVFVMRHVDYNPERRENVNFEVEYRIRPTQKLKKSQGLIQNGKETLVHGFIVDWNDQEKRWIIEVTGLNVASGHEAASKKKSTVGTKVTPTGRVRPAKHVPNSSPIRNTQASDKDIAFDTSKTKESTHLGQDEGLNTGPVEPTIEPTPEAGPSTPRGTGSGRAAKKAKLN